MCVCVRACMHVHVCVPACVYARVCVCVCVSVCVFLRPGVRVCVPSPDLIPTTDMHRIARCSKVV